MIFLQFTSPQHPAPPESIVFGNFCHHEPAVPSTPQKKKLPRLRVASWTWAIHKKSDPLRQQIAKKMKIRCCAPQKHIIFRRCAPQKHLIFSRRCAPQKHLIFFPALRAAKTPDFSRRCAPQKTPDFSRRCAPQKHQVFPGPPQCKFWHHEVTAPSSQPSAPAAAPPLS